jgi:hypothetical protein
MKFSAALILALVLATLGCGGMRPPNVAPAEIGVVSKDPKSWYILYSSGTGDHPQAATNAAWVLPLPSDGHLNYVQSPYRTAARPQQIVLSYRIVQSPNAVAASSEDAASPCREHNPCTHVAEFHVFFEQQEDNLSSECGRWWYIPGYRLTDVPDASYTVDTFVADGEPHTLTIPLTKDLWTSVTGHGNASDFESALMNVGFVGITFGGSDFFGHGVYMRQGTLQFHMIDYRVE